jgi:esterase/lipase
MKRVRGFALFLFVVILIGIFICLFDLYINSFDAERQKVVVLSQGEKFEGTYLKGKVGEERGIILLHDKGTDRNSMGALASAFNKEGYHVLYYDMPGHGYSEGIFNQGLYTDTRLQVLLEDAVNQLIIITELKREDISFAGTGLGARVILKHSANMAQRNNLYLIKPYAVRQDSDLSSKELVKIGRKDDALILYSNMDKEYVNYIMPEMYERITNEKFVNEQARNVSLHGNIETGRFDLILPGFENNSNSFIKKIIFTASMKEGFELSNDYFNTRSLIFYLILMLMICELFLLQRAFLPNIPSTKTKKTPYEYGVKRLLWSFIIIAVYISYKLYFKRVFVTNIEPFYERLLIIFVIYGLTGVFSMKYKKAVKIGDSGVSAAVSILIGGIMLCALALWVQMGIVGYSFIDTKLIYLLITIGCVWLGLYFYAFDFSVMYMMGASKQGQKYLIRLVFMLPFIMMLIIDYLNESEFLFRNGLQYALIFLCLYFTEGLQRLGNKMLYSSFFGAVLYGFITLAFTVNI